MKLLTYEIGSRSQDTHKENSDLDLCLLYFQLPTLNEFKKQMLIQQMKYPNQRVDFLPVSLKGLSKKVSIYMPSYLCLLSQTNIKHDLEKNTLPHLTREQIYHSVTLSMALRLYYAKGMGNKQILDKELKRLVWHEYMHEHPEGINFCKCFLDDGIFFEKLKFHQNWDYSQWVRHFKIRKDKFIEYCGKDELTYNHIDDFYISYFKPLYRENSMDIPNNQIEGMFHPGNLLNRVFKHLESD